MTVAGYWKSITNGTKIQFKVIAKKTQSIFLLDNGGTYKMNEYANVKMYPCLKNQTEKTFECRMLLSNELKGWILLEEAAIRGILYKKGVLQNFLKFTGKHLCQSL